MNIVENKKEKPLLTQGMLKHGIVYRIVKVSETGGAGFEHIGALGIRRMPAGFQQLNGYSWTYTNNNIYEEVCTVDEMLKSGLPQEPEEAPYDLLVCDLERGKVYETKSLGRVLWLTDRSVANRLLDSEVVCAALDSGQMYVFGGMRDRRFRRVPGAFVVGGGL